MRTAKGLLASELLTVTRMKHLALSVTLIEIVLLAGFAAAEDQKPVEVRLAAGGKALQVVTVSENATERVVAEARDLAAYLERISSDRFQVQKGDGSSGLAVETCKEFPGLSLDSNVKNDPFHKGNA